MCNISIICFFVLYIATMKVARAMAAFVPAAMACLVTAHVMRSLSTIT